MRLIHPVSMSLSVQMFFELSARRGCYPVDAAVGCGVGMIPNRTSMRVRACAGR